MSKRIRYLSIAAPHDRSNRENFVLLANSAVLRLALCTTRKTDDDVVPGGTLHGQWPAPVVVPGHAMAAP